MTDRERHIERLFRQHYSAMHLLAYMLLHNDDDSKDVVHDVFAKLLVEQTELRETTVLPYLLIPDYASMLTAISPTADIADYFVSKSELSQKSSC